LFLISWQSAMLATISLGAYSWALETYGPGPHSRTIALYSLVSLQLGHTFNCRSRIRSAFEGLFKNHFLWIAVVMVVLLQVAATYFSPLAIMLGTVKPNTVDLFVISGCGLLPIVIVEIVKHLSRRNISRHGYTRLTPVKQHG
jgi:P-type Ca2+ transporter type 2C